MDEEALIRAFEDKTRPASTRAAEATAIGRLVGRNYRAWGALCEVFQDETDTVEVRLAAARTIGEHHTMAVNQLVRAVQGDRRVRMEAIIILARLGYVDPKMEPALQRDLGILSQQMAIYPLVNLALCYGRDPRVLTVLHKALQHPEPSIRKVAQHGLGMLGELSAVIGALADKAPDVRAGAAQTLGYFGLASSAEIRALEIVLGDTDPKAQEAAQVALRRLGVRPIARPRTETKMRSRHAAVAASSRYDWAPLLERWSWQWLQIQSYALELPDEVVESGWIGFPSASDKDLERAERRPGRSLPPSYREFLKITNGWRRTTPFIQRLWPIDEVDFFRTRHQQWIDVYLVDEPLEVSVEEHLVYGETQDPITFRAEYLQTAIEISEEGDAAIYLLNPEVVTPDGEWEAWFLASWLPGARRYPSYWDLMQAEYASFIQLEKPVG